MIDLYSFTMGCTYNFSQPYNGTFTLQRLISVLTITMVSKCSPIKQL